MNSKHVMFLASVHDIRSGVLWFLSSHRPLFVYTSGEKESVQLNGQGNGTGVDFRAVFFLLKYRFFFHGYIIGCVHRV